MLITTLKERSEARAVQNMGSQTRRQRYQQLRQERVLVHWRRLKAEAAMCNTTAAPPPPLPAQWGDKNTFGVARKLLYMFHKARKAAKRSLVVAFRASWFYRKWVAHMHTCKFVDPAGGKTNARCWNETSSNLRAVYDAIVTHRPSLPPCVAHVYLRQRRIVYHSITGPVDVWVRPRDTVLDLSGGRVVVVDDGLRFATPVPWWVRCTWAMERRVFAVVDRIARSLRYRKLVEHHSKRSFYSRMLYQLS